MSNTIDTIFATFGQLGHLAYGERVTQLQHALQTAHLARADGAPPLLIAAALLHDYGHLLQAGPEDIAEQGVDAVHEDLGAEYLSTFFEPAVTEPGRLHVAAKRYLCATDTAYLNTLSEASVQSLQLQGGPFSEKDIEIFQRSPFHAEALRLRHWDDMGKQPDMESPDLETYRSCLEAGLH